MPSYADHAEAEKAAQNLGVLRVLSRVTRTVSEDAPPAHTTLTLFEDAAGKYGWSSEKSMAVAQGLFEHGLITYPRTDSTHVAQEAVTSARKIILERHGITALKGLPIDTHLISLPSAGESGAHEAIRPADPTLLPEEQGGLLPDHARLYELIWQRFIASQMRAAKYQIVEVELEST